MKLDSRLARKVRHKRVTKKVVGTTLCPRLCVFRSLNHIYAQVIDDSIGHTLISMSTLDPQIRDETRQRVKIKTAEMVGSQLAEKALSRGISHVFFDRGGYRYHGRVKALAEAAREAGLLF